LKTHGITCIYNVKPYLVNSGLLKQDHSLFCYVHCIMLSDLEEALLGKLTSIKNQGNTSLTQIK